MPGKSYCHRFMATLAFVWALSAPVCFSDPSPLTDAFATSGGEPGAGVLRYRVGKDESLIEIARRFHLGFNSIVDANPGVDPFIPAAGTMIDIPATWIMPAISIRPAIVVNIPEFRLYYLPSSGRAVTFPLGIGDEGTDSPLGDYTVIEKIINPSWHVPASIRAQVPGLPKVVPPGPENPMGSHALRLSLSTVLLHGTNRPWGIGRRSSHGCLRLYPEDIVVLFNLVPKGMRVIIVNQPIKIGVQGQRVFVEAHRYQHDESEVGAALQLLSDRKLLRLVDFSLLIRAITERKGVPVEITLAR